MVQGRRKRPLNALVITRERIQEVLDDAVERGRMTRDDASDLFGELVRRGTGGIAAGARKVTGQSPAFPIADYEDLTAAQVAERLDALSVAQLRQVRDHERRNANRKGVLSAIESKLK
jgi:polyhydroxyalkanoate synthesis regulator phasin